VRLYKHLLRLLYRLSIFTGFYVVTGTGIQLFGHANSQKYAINLDGQPRQIVQRHYAQSEVPIADSRCTNPTPDECVVLYETSGLNPNEMHTLVLTSQLDEQSAEIDVMSATVPFDAGISVYALFYHNIDRIC
jgi:hypothetical protein